jgi:hypothetical protein
MIVADLAAAVVSLVMAGTARHAAALVLLLGVSSIAQAPFETGICCGVAESRFPGPCRPCK